VIGVFDGITKAQNGAWGWACQIGVQNSLAIQVYVKKSGKNIKLGDYVANFASEKAVENRCKSGGKHRFFIPLADFANYKGLPVLIFASPKENTIQQNGKTVTVGVTRIHSPSDAARNVPK
jgi:hypothetical protein